MKLLLFYSFIALAILVGLDYFNLVNLPFLADFKVDLPAPYSISGGKVKIKVLQYGDGPASRTGSSVVIQYTAKDEYGRVFAQASADAPLLVTLGSEDVIPGLEAGLRGMQVGEKRLIYIQPELAYGTTGNRELGVAPNQEVVYEVYLLKIR